MKITELLDEIENKNIEWRNNSLNIVRLYEIYKNIDIVINTTTFTKIDKYGKSIVINIRRITFWQCTFNSIDISNKINLDLFNIDECKLNKVNINNQSFKLLSVGTAKIKEIELNDVKINSFHIFNSIVNSLKCQSIEIKEIDLMIYESCYLYFSILETCNNLKIKVSGNADKFIFFGFDNVKNISITGMDNNLNVKELTLFDHKNIENIELKNITVDFVKLHSNIHYDEVHVTILNINILNQFNIENINFGKSIFKNINLSKCQFNNSLIAEAKFLECEVESIPDFPFEKFLRFSPIIFLLMIFFALWVSNNIWYQWRNEFISTTFIILSALAGSFFIALSLSRYEHKATLDEKREKYKGFKDTWEFVKSHLKTYKTFFVKANEEELYKLKEIESINRQLKVSFQSIHDVQNANEFLYSEILMKIRQRNIWMNIANVDLWNYLINGFGRRWVRAFMNLVIVFIVAIFIFILSAPFPFIVKDKAPQFMLDANKTVFQNIPKEVLEKGILESISMNSNKTKASKDKSQEPIDGIPIVSNLFKLSTVYTLSKLDIFKVRTKGWFEETSFWNFFKANIIGLVLLFLLGSFVLAFKRRLDK